MLSRSRRKAREGAMRVLYELELGHPTTGDAIEHAAMEMEITHDLADYMLRLVTGVRENRAKIDETVASYVKGYDFDRLAVVDRNILRIAAFELLFVPEIPPAVTINEAIEIARRYSTLESPKFVNGVLGALVRNSDKANWDPATAPAEFGEEGSAESEAPDIEELEVAPDDESFRVASRVGGWKIRQE